MVTHAPKPLDQVIVGSQDIHLWKSSGSDQCFVSGRDYYLIILRTKEEILKLKAHGYHEQLYISINRGK